MTKLRKIYYPFLLILMLAVCSSCDKKRNDLFEMGLKGQVKTVTRYAGYLEAGELAQGSMKEKFSFNEAGNITELLVFNSKGEVARREETLYNDKGEKVKTDYYDDYAMLYQTCFYVYDQKGRKTSTTYRNSDGGLIERLDYSYDYLGNDTLRTSYDKEDNVKMICSCIFGKNGKVLLEEIYNAKRVLVSRECFQYNDDGAMTRFYSYSVENVLEFEMNFKYEDYDRKGNSHVMKLYDKDQQLLGGTFQMLEYY